MRWRGRRIVVAQSMGAARYGGWGSSPGGPVAVPLQAAHAMPRGCAARQAAAVKTRATDRGEHAPRSAGPDQLLVTVCWVDPSLLVQVTVPPTATATGVGLKALPAIVTPAVMGGDPGPPTTTDPVIPPWKLQW